MRDPGGEGLGEEARNGRRWRILKFGGSSVSTAAGADAIAGVVRTALRDRVSPVVVVSAFAGVTDALHASGRAVARGEGRVREWSILRRLHQDRLRELTGGKDPSLAADVDASLDEAERLLRGMALLGESPARTLDALLATGEIVSAGIVTAALEARGIRARAQDASDWIRTADRFGGAEVALPATRLHASRAAATAAASGLVPVVPGFLGAGPNGETTTLGRGGSDLSAAVLGACLSGVERVEIWTDVDGVLSADPRIVPDARLLHRVSYRELLELTHGGARVVHPEATRLLADKGIPVVVRNTFAPGTPGTTVSADGGSGAEAPVRGVASDVGAAVVRITAGSADGVPGLVSGALGALEAGRIRVLLVSRGAGSPSLCVAIPAESADSARRVLDRELRPEREGALVGDVVVEADCSVITVVGEGMRSRPGISGRFLGVLGRHGINVRAIAQGASENAISAVVSGRDGPAALRVVHDAFFAPRPRRVRVYLAGVGRVGSALLAQLARRGRPERVVLAGVAGSRVVALDPDGLDAEGWNELTVEGDGSDLLEAAVANSHHPSVFVDCTASPEVAAWYPRLLDAGVAVVTANKVAPAGPLERVRTLLDARREGAGLYFETTVAAGLPVLRTVQDLVATGDTIHRVEGILSGTLGYLCDGVMTGRTFSETLREAHERGFTEPDPRDDLSGRDVARKVLILSRCAGFELDEEDLDVTPLLSSDDGASLEDFWASVAREDQAWADRREDALGRGGRLAYVGRVDARGGRVALEVVDAAHPCGRARGTENVVTVTSDRYREPPLVVTGPGAGPDVTAAGVFADILRARAEAADPPVRLGPWMAAGERHPAPGSDLAPVVGDAV